MPGSRFAFRSFRAWPLHTDCEEVILFWAQVRSFLLEPRAQGFCRKGRLLLEYRFPVLATWILRLWSSLAGQSPRGRDDFLHGRFSSQGWLRLSDVLCGAGSALALNARSHSASRPATGSGRHTCVSGLAGAGQGLCCGPHPFYESHGSIGFYEVREFRVVSICGGIGWPPSNFGIEQVS